MGEQNPLVVLDDAELGLAVDCAMPGAFFQTGQRCTASSRLMRLDAMHDTFVDAMLEAMRALRIGRTLADDTQIGPVVSRSCARPRLPDDRGRGRGARLAWGGDRLERETEATSCRPRCSSRPRTRCA
ncbi:MAG: aldehyde dehydrogenase family protein [Actinomycetota bacterium]